LYPRRYRSKWRDWNDRYLDYVEGGYSKVFVGIKLEELDNLRKELGVIMVYRRKEDELDLPERIDDEIHVELTPGQRKIYDELVGTCIAKLDDDTFIAAEDGLPMLTKLRQIATGLDLVGEDVHDSSKLDLAAEMIEDNVDEQFVVFSWFKAACSALAQRLGGGAVITSDIAQHKRDPLIEAFMSGEERILIATIGTMGESQNLQNANNAIFLDRSWNPAENTQAEDRIYRYGQDKKVTITHLIAKDTVDEHRVTPTIINKEALRRMILGG
jgi:SNF2 family DNA or RNA helicase